MAKHGPEPAGIVAIHPLYTLKTDVIFSVRGQHVRLRLDRRTSNRFLEYNTVGTTGLLTWRGRRMVSWEPVGSFSSRRVGSARRRKKSKQRQAVSVRPAGANDVFLSYSSKSSADAAWVRDVLETAGLSVWVDERELVPGQSLPRRIHQAIASTPWFVPLIDNDYMASDWCRRELAAAVQHGTRVAPVNVGWDRPRVPEALRDMYEDSLGEPLMLDLRAGNAERRLSEFATQITGSR